MVSTVLTSGSILTPLKNAAQINLFVMCKKEESYGAAG